MWELRWILAGLGVLLLGALYLWGRSSQRKARQAEVAPQTQPPSFEEDGRTAIAAETDGNTEESIETADSKPTPALPSPRPETIIALRLIPRSGVFSATEAIASLRSAGMAMGKFGIFHFSAPDTDAELFSVANLVEPGSFEFDDVEEASLPGMTVFMVLPGPEDVVSRFDRMVQTARVIAVELDGELFDDRGSSWSIQRERYMREELIRYRLDRQRG
jgi:cell division protein ZipA